jgi:NADH dehydrogenase/NADH:ubiquinone oxidoreductase subunit G
MTAFIRAALFEPAAAFEIHVDGEPVLAHAGESVAAALLAAGRLGLSAPADPLRPRGVFCGIGACYGCLVTVDGTPNVRACATPARPGQRVELSRHAAR